MDKHMEDFHFLEVLNEEDDEDEKDDAMETVNFDINIGTVNEVSEEYDTMDNVHSDINVEIVIKDIEEYEVVDPADMNLVCEENLDINLNLVIKKSLNMSTPNLKQMM